MIADVSLGVGMGTAPLFRGLPEERNVEQFGLGGIDEPGLGFVMVGGMRVSFIASVWMR